MHGIPRDAFPAPAPDLGAQRVRKRARARARSALTWPFARRIELRGASAIDARYSARRLSRARARGGRAKRSAKKHWRRRVGIEPTLRRFRAGTTVLKTAEATRPHSPP